MELATAPMPYGDRFNAAGTLLLAPGHGEAALAPLAQAVAANGYQARPTLAETLRHCGWLVGTGRGGISASAGSSGMFSGRWGMGDEAVLRAMAAVGFHGDLVIEGEETSASYTLGGGVVSAEAFFPEEAENEPDAPEDGATLAR